MMTLILIVSGLLIAFVGFLRYDMHKYKYRDAQQKAAEEKTPAAAPSDSKPEAQ